MTDFAVGQTFDVKFTTRRFTTGAPFTLAGTPAVAAYPDNSVTQITAGITLTVDFDALTGLNNVRVVATGANGYAAGSSYDLVITAGTVDSVSVVGEVVGSFTLERGAAFGRLGAPAGASIAADLAAIEAQTDDIGVAGAGLTALGDTRIANLDAAVTTRATPAQVNTEVVDALNVDTYAEPGLGAPPATATLVQKIGYLFKSWRNRTTQTATTYTLFADDATTANQTAAVSDDGTTFDRGEVG